MLPATSPSGPAASSSPYETEVLVVGGGPVGLTSALLLARQGVRVLLAERHPGTSIHPRARGINVRSMEIFRALGIEEAIRTYWAEDKRISLYVLGDEFTGDSYQEALNEVAAVNKADRII